MPLMPSRDCLAGLRRVFLFWVSLGLLKTRSCHVAQAGLNLTHLAFEGIVTGAMFRTTITKQTYKTILVRVSLLWTDTVKATLIKEIYIKRI